jgi:acetyltransferase-like isoleucine patch superfamily enzyme
MNTKRSSSSIDAEHLSIGSGCRIDGDSRVCAADVVIGRDVVIEAGVRISADRVAIGDGCRIRRNASIVSPEIRIGAQSMLGEDSSIELNAHLRIGTLADVGRRLRIVGQGVEAGDHLWVTDEVTIGGGGARGPRSYLTVGHRCAIMERSFINIAEPVAIGDETAFSNNVVVLTHSMWPSALEGGTATFSPVRIGSGVILYVNAVVAPGVTIGNHVTVGAGAIVLGDVPDGSMAIGNPARIFKKVPPFPRALGGERCDALLRELLREYAVALATKGATVTAESDDTLAISLDGSLEVLRYLASDASARSREIATITVAVGAAAAGTRGRVHLDLAARTMEGEPTAVAEDFRDFLRRRSIRVFTEQPFRSLPLANAARLKARLHGG